MSNAGRTPGGHVLAIWAGGLILCLLATRPLSGQEYLKQALVVPGDVQPIHLHGERVTTWLDGDRRIVLLKGKVWIGQGLKVINAPAAAVWIDEARHKKTGVYHLDIYAEDTVQVSEGARRQSANRALLQLATRSEVRVKSFSDDVSKKPAPQDNLYRMGARELETAGTSAAREPEAPPAPKAFPLTAPASDDALKDLPPTVSARSMRTDPAIQRTNFETEALPVPPPPPPGSKSAPPPNAGVARPLSVDPGQLPDFDLPPVLPPATPGKTTSNAGPQMLPPADDNRPPVFPSGPTPPPGPIDIQPPPPQPSAPQIQTTPRTVPPQQPPGSALPAPPPQQRGGIMGGFSATTPGSNPRRVSIRPRSSAEIQARNFPQSDGSTAVVVTSGIILTVVDPTKKEEIIDIEADRLVFWTSGDSRQLLDGMRSSSANTNQSLEFYMSGNVEVRGRFEGNTQTLRAEEVYYDVSRNVAIASQADLEVRQGRLPNPLHMKANEIIQYNPKLFKAFNNEIYSSKLPSDPGLRLVVRESSLEEREYEPRNFIRLPWSTGTEDEPKTTQKILRGRNVVVYARRTPIFYWPYIQGDPEDPMGPLEKISANYNNIFGAQLYTTWNLYDLLGVDPLPGTRLRLMADYLSERGPALGTEFDYAGKDLFGIPSRFQGLFKGYMIYDDGVDRLGGNRGIEYWVSPTDIRPITHPDFRGRLLHRLNVQDMPNGFSVLTQASYLSDPNFLEQFFFREYREDPNQETYVHVKQQNENFAWTFLVEPRIRNWVTETAWLPKADAHLIGQKYFDLFTHTMQASAGYAQLGITDLSPPVYPTDMAVQTGRFDLFNEVSLPFYLGPVKVVPYLVGDVTYYTQDLYDDDKARLYGGAGVRASLPFSRLYPTACSELFNVNSIFHKIVLYGNYYNAVSDTNFRDLPQLDRFNDDISDQSIRDIYPRQFLLNPQNAVFLRTSELFDPQEYALRRMILSQIDTRDDIDVLRMGMRQRWQTKRGFPGNQHVVDWMVLDVQGSLFPHRDRDNFGELFGVLEYDWVWNIGDRTSLVSSGWFETIAGGPRVFNIGANINRPDHTNFYIGYRQIDPLETQAVIASMTFAFNPKYSLTASSTYDFGIDNQSNNLMISRIGTDVTLSFGFNYNSILDTFGINFAITPNLLPSMGPMQQGMARR